MSHAAWELARLDGVGQAELIARGELTAAELAEAALARIDEVDPLLDAVMWRMTDLEQQLEGLKEPAVAASPLAGAPTLLKDVGQRYAGAPRWDGSRFLGGVVDDRDSELVARMRRAGLVFVGKSTSSELGNSNETSFPGPTNNPWDTGRSTGGSSAGAGAAVGARLVPLAHGSDAGGSIRWPAAWCGVFGLKPTRARNPLGPDGWEGTGGLVVAHMLTVSVRDSAAALQALAGPDVGGPFVAPNLPGDYLKDATTDPGPLRIAVSTQTPDGRAVDPRCRAAALDAARLCEELGHTVVEDAPQYDIEALLHAFEEVTFDGNAAALAALETALGKRGTEADFDPITWWLMQRGQTRSAADHVLAAGRLHRIARDLVAFFGDYDVFLTPSNPTPAATHEELTPTAAQVPEVWWERELGGGIFMLPANATGQPAMSVPLWWSDEGLPVGTHFIGALGREDILLRLAGQLERARPWGDRVPPVTPQTAVTQVIAQAQERQ